MDDRLEQIQTADGSHTFYHKLIGEHYHSKHGALQESKHVFLESGTQYYLEQHLTTSISILEVGFGTGLNYLLTADFCKQHHIGLSYRGIERYPLARPLLETTGYKQYMQSDKLGDRFYEAYERCFQDVVEITPANTLHIHHTDVQTFHTDERFDVIYFDAFAATHQPEMWTESTLRQVCQYLKPGGVFVTYAITGNLKRIMKNLGFTIQKLPGASGKREMLRAILV